MRRGEEIEKKRGKEGRLSLDLKWKSSLRGEEPAYARRVARIGEREVFLLKSEVFREIYLGAEKV